MSIGMECDSAPFTWAYGALLGSPIPRKVAETRRLDGSDSEKAIALVKQFNPQQVYVYAMGREPWLTYITSIQYTPDSKPIIESAKLVEFCRQHNIVSEILHGKKEITVSRSSQKAEILSNKHNLKLQIHNSSNELEDIENKIFVNYLNNLVIKLSLDKSELCIDHLIHDKPASSNLLFDRLNAAGYQIDRLDYQKWYEQLINIANNSQDHILYPLVSLFSANNSGEAQNKSFNRKFDCKNVSEGLAKSSSACPAIDRELIDTYISYLVERDLLLS